MRSVVPAAAAVLLVLLAAGPADARLRASDLGRAPEVVADDGRRLATTAPFPSGATGSVLVRDLATRHRERFEPPVPGCRFRDIDGGALLWSCRGTLAASVAVLRDIRRETLSVVMPPQEPGLATADASAEPAEVGSHWVRFRITGYHYAVDRFIERSSGRVRSLDPLERRWVPDLDRPGLVRRLCRGLTAPLVPDGSGLRLVAGPLAIVGRAAASKNVGEGLSPRIRILLRRCGRPARVLADCTRRYCSEPRIDARRVVWADRRDDRARVRIHDLRKGRTRSVTLPRVAREHPRPAVHLVRGRLWATNGMRWYRITGF